MAVKIEIRKLPPLMKEEEFVNSLGSPNPAIVYKYYVQGKLK